IKREMAHLIEPSFSPTNDGMWPLAILVTDMNIQRNLYVRGDQHVGGVMIKLTQDIDLSRDWSDHELWWPDKRKWLKHTRSTLDQLGITADTKLEFTPMHKDARIQLPDMQIIDARVDFSVNVVKATQKLCRDLGIRYSEELSLKRHIPVEILRKNSSYEADNGNGPQLIRPGEESVGPMTLRKATPIWASSQNLSGSTMRMRQQSPALSTSGHIFNAHEMGTLPRHGTLPRGASPSPGAYNETLRRAPIMPSVSFSEGLEREEFDQQLVHSPRIAPNRDLPVFRPQNYTDKAALNRGWLDSSRSLMEQGVYEGDVILLRFKFMAFFDMNAKYDPVRINQLFEQAKWSILLEEFDHTEEEASLFAALQLQAQLARDSPEPEGNGRDDVDVLLDELEQTLDAAAIGRRSDLTQVPELGEYLKYMKPKKLAAFKGFKRAFFTFRDLYLSYHASGADAGGGPPLGHFNLKGCEVSPDISVAQGKYQIKLLVPTAEGMTDLVLKCDTELQYAKWMAACRLASRGKSMADASYQSEVDAIKNLLKMQNANGNGRHENGTGPKKQSVQLPGDFNVDEYVSGRYVRRARSKQSLQQRISDAHSNVKNLSATDAKLQYIRAWQSLPEVGTHYFVVRFRAGKKPELIGVATNRIVKINPDNGETLKTWRFAQMKKWHVNWEIRHLKVQFEDEDLEFKPLSADCKVVHEFIGGYIFMSMRNKEQSQTLDEEMFQKLTGGWQ
ncbi:unc-112, partial [Pristionchus pacificus]